MCAREAEKPSSAGDSVRPVDVAAVFERLKDEVRRGRGAGSPDRPGRPGQVAARTDAERLWSVSVDAPIERRPGPGGALVYRLKRALRKLMSWYVGPFAVDQRGFNHALLRVADELDARLRTLEEELERRRPVLEDLSTRLDQADEDRSRLRELLDELEPDHRLATELEERLLRLERRRSGPPRPPAAAATRDPPALDYFAFEARMRGTTADIRGRQSAYLDDFRDGAPVLDVGSGRGEFLGLLRHAGIEARGVEIDADMVAYARGDGLEVAEADALAYLEGLEDGSLGGIFAAQVVEHLPAATLVRLLELAVQKLRPGGVLVAETINPLAPLAMKHYFSDLTHAQPLVPETLALLARHAGFAEPEIRYLNPPEERLAPVELPADPAFDPARRALARNVGLLNDHVFAPLDYALVARVPA
jgi:O-antigen chain-terminating methyltransferase